jgi:MFS family permease
MKPAESIEPEVKTPWWRVLLFVGAGVVAAFQVGKAPPVLPAIQTEFGMSLFLGGWVLSTVNVTGLFLGSIAGALADRFGYRRLLITGLICQAAGSLVGSWSTGPPLLFATRVLEGLGFISVAVAAPALIFRITRPRDLRLSLSLWSCYLPAGVAAIMVIAPSLDAALGWRGLWQVNAGVLSAYAAGVAIATKPRSGRSSGAGTRPRPVWQDVRKTSTATGPLLLALIFAAYALMWLAVMGFMPTLLTESYGVKSADASYLTALMVAVNVPGNLAGGWLLQRGWGRERLIAAAIAVMGLCSLGIYAEGLPFLMRYLACLAFSACGGLLPAAIMSAVPLYAPEPRLVGSTNGLIVQGSNLGQVIGPPVLAIVVSAAGGWHAAPWFLGIVAVAGLILSSYLHLLEKRKG